MNGPAHYQRAEVLLQTAAQDFSLDPELHYRRVLAAQVHATLAVAAATAEMTGRGSERDQQWREVLDG